MDYKGQRSFYKENEQKPDTAIITGYKYSATGVYGYRYYLDKKEICSISGHVLPSWPLNIYGKTVDWKIDLFDIKSQEENHIVLNRINEKPVFHFEALGNDRFQIVFSNDDSPGASARLWEVSCQKSQYSVYELSHSTHAYTKPVAMMERFYAENRVPEIDGMDVEPYFKASIYDWQEKTEEEVMAVLSLPSILRIR